MKNAFITPQLVRGKKLSHMRDSTASNPFRELDITSIVSLQNNGFRSSQIPVFLPPLQNQ